MFLNFWQCHIHLFTFEFGLGIPLFQLFALLISCLHLLVMASNWTSTDGAWRSKEMPVPLVRWQYLRNNMTTCIVVPKFKHHCCLLPSPHKTRITTLHDSITAEICFLWKRSTCPTKIDFHASSLETQSLHMACRIFYISRYDWLYNPKS